jgi:hypothetical protein
LTIVQNLDALGDPLDASKVRVAGCNHIAIDLGDIDGAPHFSPVVDDKQDLRTGLSGARGAQPQSTKRVAAYSGAVDRVGARACSE